MLLTEWIGELGHSRQVMPASLSDVSMFLFGTQYYVQLRTGMGYQDNDLERLLQLMRDEFVAHNTLALLREDRSELYPHMSVERGRESVIAPRLVVRPVSWTGASTEPPDIDETITKIRDAVTFYNLSSEWKI